MRRTISRRQMLKFGAVAACSIAGSRLLFEGLARIAPADARAALDPAVAAYDPSAHRWGFVVDADRCIGCGLCVVACKDENNVPLDAEHTRTWIERHSLGADGTLTIDAPEAGIGGFASATAANEAPAPDGDGVVTHFVPRLCMQCENSPCTSVCPVGATYRTADGVILIDPERCIGCGYCLVACPYGARYLVPAGDRLPGGVAGVADKCTFCYHRVTLGLDPACVAVCPVQARLFGDLNDAASEVSAILRDGTTAVMRPELGTRPRVHYLGLRPEELA